MFTCIMFDCILSIALNIFKTSLKHIFSKLALSNTCRLFLDMFWTNGLCAFYDTNLKKNPIIQQLFCIVYTFLETLLYTDNDVTVFINTIMNGNYIIFVI